MSIVLKNVSKSFGPVKAVDNLSFAVHPGEVTGLLGPNGAGKTTTVRLISGFLAPSAGTIEINGVVISREAVDVRRQIGYLPEDNPLYNDMNVIDYLEFTAGLQGVSRIERNHRVGEMLDQFGLETVRYHHIGSLSRGYRQRVGLAQTLVHNPRILILDEPTTGLDPNQVIEFRRFVSELGKERAVIFSTHNLAEVQALCSRVIIMSKGKILSDASIADLQQEFQGGMQYFVTIESTMGMLPEAVKHALKGVQCIKEVAELEHQQNNTGSRSFYVEAETGSNVVKELFGLCAANDWTLVDVQRRRVKIEDIFHQLTRGKAS